MTTEEKLTPMKSHYVRLEFLVQKSTHDILKGLALEAGKSVSDVVGMMIATCLTGLVEARNGARNTPKEEQDADQASTVQGNEPAEEGADRVDGTSDTSGAFRGRVKF